MLNNEKSSRRQSFGRTLKERPIRGLRPSARARAEYEAWLVGVIRSMERDVKKDILPAIKLAIVDSPADDIQGSIDRLASKYEMSSKFFESNAATFVSKVDKANARAFERSLPDGFGVDLMRIIRSTGETEKLKNNVRANVALIKTISSEYFSKVERAIWLELSGSSPSRKSLTEKLVSIGGVSRARAKMIARDQTSKINAQLTIERAQSIGTGEFIWHTAEDERVVGNPGGLYPSGNRIHGNHYKRNGKRYKFGEQPADGYPGEPIGCRCWMEPVVVI